MTGSGLRAELAALRLSQVDFAGLLFVTPRAVHLWLTDERKIPGPVIAWLAIFKSLSRSAQLLAVDDMRAARRKTP